MLFRKVSLISPKVLLLILLPLITSEIIELDLTTKTLKPEISSDMNSFEDGIKPFDVSVLEQEVLTVKSCIGSPPQCFDVIYDTGSFHLWVTSKSSHTCDTCKRFDRWKSYTFTNNYESITLGYVTGSAYGNHVTDYVDIGGDKSLSSHFEWMLADSVEFKVKGADGIMGFGRDYEANKKDRQITKWFSIMETLKFFGRIDQKVFSQKYEEEDKTKAKLFIGGVHQDFNSPINLVNSCKLQTSDPAFSSNKVGDLWTCRLAYITLGEASDYSMNYSRINVHERAVIDTGSNYIMAPMSYSNDFRKFLDSYTSPPNCQWETDKENSVFYCDPEFDTSIVPDLWFVINGHAFKIPVSDLFREVNESGFHKKVFTIFFKKKLDFWLLGHIFMKNLHILFDHEGDKVTFSGSSEYVKDVSWYTTDEDFVFSDYLVWFILLFIFCGIVFIGIIYCICKKRSSSAVVNTNVNTGSSSYNLFNNQGNNFNSQYSPPSTAYQSAPNQAYGGYAYPGANNNNRNDAPVNINTY